MEQIKENKLGVMPVPKLLASMSIPLIVANVITALYNVVDGIYVAQLSETALAATTLAYPAQMVMQAVASGTAGGVNSLLSRRLGAKRFGDANDAASHGLVLSAIGYLLFLVLGLTLSRWFIGLFTDEQTLYTMGYQYLEVCLCGSVGIFFAYAFNSLLESTGHTGFCLIMQGTGGIINIVLDPILIFGRFGFPEMGIRGAAVATVISQCIGAVLGLIFCLTGNHDIQISFKGFRMKGPVVKEIYQVGVPAMLMMGMGSLMNVGMNKILIAISDTAVSVFGIYYKLQNFVFMPVFGITQGMVPIVGYNYGARRPARMKQALKLALVVSAVIMGIGTVVLHLWPEAFLRLFSATEEMYEIGVPALRITSIPFIMSAFCIVLGDFLNGLGIGYVTAVNSFLRQILILLPLAWLFERLFGIHYVWYAFVASEFMSLGYSTVMFFKLWKQKVKPLEADTQPAA